MKIWIDPNSDRTPWPSISGAAGTYNHLVDAILDVRCRMLILDRAAIKIFPLALHANLLFVNPDKQGWWKSVM